MKKSASLKSSDPPKSGQRPSLDDGKRAGSVVREVGKIQRNFIGVPAEYYVRQY
jgi:hypothetical protein